MKYLRTVHDCAHNRPYHSLAIASTKRDKRPVCAVCLPTPCSSKIPRCFDGIKWKNQTHTHLAILPSCYRQCHRLQIKTCVFFAVVLQDCPNLASLLVSLESDERKWHWPPSPGLKYVIHEIRNCMELNACPLGGKPLTIAYHQGQQKQQHDRRGDSGASGARRRVSRASCPHSTLVLSV